MTVSFQRRFPGRWASVCADLTPVGRRRGRTVPGSAPVALGPAVARDRPARARRERLDLLGPLGPAPVVVLVAERRGALAGGAVGGEERRAPPAAALEHAPL